jgi:hypothetical protein
MLPPLADPLSGLSCVSQLLPPDSFTDKGDLLHFGIHVGCALLLSVQHAI